MNKTSLRDLPFTTIALVAICVTAWLAQVAHGAPVSGTRPFDLIDWGGSLPLYVLTGEPWRLLTALFLHVSLVHLALNMLMLGLMGPQVERTLGSARMLEIFVVGGVLANAANVGWTELHSSREQFGGLVTVLAGSSGGLMALLGALLAPSMLSVLGQEPYATLLGRQIDRNLLVTIAINVGICFLIPHWDKTINIAGALAGLLVSTILLVAPWRNDTMASLMRFAAVGLVLAACVGGVARGGDRDFVDQLRGEYDSWRAANR